MKKTIEKFKKWLITMGKMTVEEQIKKMRTDKYLYISKSRQMTPIMLPYVDILRWANLFDKEMKNDQTNM